MIASLRALQPVHSEGTYHAGYILVAVIYIGYTLSLWLRARRARRAIESAALAARG